jgi:hypothetical protein
MHVQSSPAEGSGVVRIFGDIDKNVGRAGESGIKAKSLDKLNTVERFFVEKLGFGTTVTIDNKKYVVGRKSLDNFLARNQWISATGKSSNEKLQEIAKQAQQLTFKTARARAEKMTHVVEESKPDEKLNINKAELTFIINNTGLREKTKAIYDSLKDKFSEKLGDYRITKKEFVDIFSKHIAADAKNEFAKAILEFNKKGIIADNTADKLTNLTPVEYDYGSEYQQMVEAEKNYEGLFILEDEIDDLAAILGKKWEITTTAPEHAKVRIEDALEPEEAPPSYEETPAHLAVALRTTERGEKPGVSLKVRLPEFVQSFSLKNGKVVEEKMKLSPSHIEVKIAVPQKLLMDKETINKELAKIETYPASKPLQQTEIEAVAASLRSGWNKTKPVFDRLSMVDKFKVICGAYGQGIDPSHGGLNTRLQKAIGQLVSHFATASALNQQEEDRNNLLAYMNSDFGNIQLNYGEGDVTTIKEDFVERLQRQAENSANLLNDPLTGETKSPERFPLVALSLLMAAKEFGISSIEFERTTNSEMRKTGRGTLEQLQKRVSGETQKAIDSVEKFIPLETGTTAERLIDFVKDVGYEAFALAVRAKPELRLKLFTQIFKKAPTAKQLNQIEAKLEERKDEESHQTLDVLLGTTSLTADRVMLAIEPPKAGKPLDKIERPDWLDTDAPEGDDDELYSETLNELERTANNPDFSINADNEKELHAFVFGLHTDNEVLKQNMKKLPLFQQYLLDDIAKSNRVTTNKDTQDFIRDNLKENYQEKLKSNKAECEQLMEYFTAKRGNRKNSKAYKYFNPLINFLNR